MSAAGGNVCVEFEHIGSVSFLAMRCVSQQVLVAFGLIIIASVSARAEGGIVIEKPYPWSLATDVISAREFSSQTIHGALESGYNEYFIGTDGKRFSIQRDKIAKKIFYPDLTRYRDIQDKVQLSPILGEITELKASAAKYPVARGYLDRQIAKLQSEVSLFEQGARKIGGVWHSAEEMARQRLEAADREAKLEAARKAEEERLSKIRADEERAAIERKAAAEAALANRIAKFKQDATDLLANTSLPASDLQEFKSLADVKELPAPTQDSISKLADEIRSFGHDGDNERLAESCRAEVSAVRALDTRGRISRAIHANNAAAALADVNSFLEENPVSPSDAQKDLWKSLASVRALCKRLRSDAQPHIEKAQSLSSSGKSGEAIQEFQLAQRVFPDPKVADIIRQLRENSLGL